MEQFEINFITNKTPFELEERVLMVHDDEMCAGVIKNINEERVEVDYSGPMSHTPQLGWFHMSFWCKTK